MTHSRDNCPVCGEPRRGGDECAGCHSDLTRLTDVERQADRLRARARSEYAHGRYRSAAEAATRLVALEATPENVKLLACAQLLAGDFPRAFRTSRGLRSASPTGFND